jgi:hypothetical protein
MNGSPLLALNMLDPHFRHSREGGSPGSPFDRSDGKMLFTYRNRKWFSTPLLHWEGSKSVKAVKRKSEA